MGYVVFSGVSLDVHNSGEANKAKRKHWSVGGFGSEAKRVAMAGWRRALFSPAGLQRLASSYQVLPQVTGVPVRSPLLQEIDDYG